ncbi:phage tail tape measure protein [Brachybacterium nesterenkovii]|uniref:phage tail tape measure protein n=1 Tax=Brachybacterium nesterenkovii TaxID=47847 RepID=UPI00321C3033
MADQTVRTIYEANVARAQQALNNLAQANDKAASSADKLEKSLKAAGQTDVKPKIDVAIEQAEKDVKRLRDDLKALSAVKSDPAVEADITDTQKKIDKVTNDLRALAKLDASPQVQADTAKAESQLQGLTARLRGMEALRAEVTVSADVDKVRSQLDKAESRLKALNGAKAEMQVTVDADSADAAFDGMKDAAADAGGEAGDEAGQAIMDGLNSVPIVGTIAGIFAGAGIVAGAAFMKALDVNAAGDMFGAQTGLDEATARKYGTAAAGAYTAAWGESIEANLATAKAALDNGLLGGDATDAEIQNVITKLTGVTDIMGADIPAAAEAAGTMLKNGLADNADEAFDIILTGYQQGMDRSDDFLDTLREYSPMFQSLGLDGQQAMGLVDQAMQSGARNSDLAADALKEFSIRAQDGSKTTTDAFKSLGLDADKMGTDVAAGGDRARGALDTVLDSLRGVTDEQERNRIGVELFGTQWEDLGNGAQVLSMDLDNLGKAWINTGDTAEDALARMSDNAASHFESAKRSIETAAVGYMGAMAEALQGPLDDMTDWVSTNKGTMMGFFKDLGNAIFDLAGAAVEWGARMMEVSGNIAGALSGIVDAVGLAVEGMGKLTGDDSMQRLGQDLQSASDSMDQFADDSQVAADRMRSEWIPAIEDTRDGFNNLMDPAILQANLDDATAIMIGQLDAFTAKVDESGGTVTINGETMDAETALNSLIEAVQGSDGTVVINGETVPAEQAYDALIQAIEEDPATVTIDANTLEAKQVSDAFVATTNALAIQVQVDANTEPGKQQVGGFMQTLEAAESEGATVPIDAATESASGSLFELMTAINGAGGTVTINGATVNATTALDMLQGQINQSNGTVTINGQSVPAQNALGTLISQVNAGNGTITIKGNKGPADQATDQAVGKANSSSGTITVKGDNGPAKQAASNAVAFASAASGTMTVKGNNAPARSSIEGAIGKANSSSGTIDVHANTGSANSAINNAARDRTAVIRVVATGAVGFANAVLGRAHGGPVPKGLAAGGTVGDGYGWVPAPYPGPGIDNIVWPLKSGRAGGGYLGQPLAGGEYVMNPVASAANAGLLEYLNNGGRIPSRAASPQVTNHFHEVGGEAAEIAARRVMNEIVRSVRSVS